MTASFTITITPAERDILLHALRQSYGEYKRKADADIKRNGVELGGQVELEKSRQIWILRGKVLALTGQEAQ